MPAARSSLAGRALLLLRTDQAMIADTFVYLQDVADLQSPSYSQLLAALAVVAQEKRPAAGKESFYRDFFSCVAANVGGGRSLQEAFDAALKLYMLPRSATIFSRLRRLRDGLRAWKRAARGGATREEVEGLEGGEAGEARGTASRAREAPRPAPVAVAPSGGLPGAPLARHTQLLNEEVSKLSLYVALSRADDFRRRALSHRAFVSLRGACSRYSDAKNAALIAQARERRVAYIRAAVDRREARNLKANAFRAFRRRAAGLREAEARCRGKAELLSELGLLARWGIHFTPRPGIPQELLARRLVLRFVFLRMKRLCGRTLVLEARLHAYELGARRRFLISVAFHALTQKYVSLVQTLVTSGRNLVRRSPPGLLRAPERSLFDDVLGVLGTALGAPDRGAPPAPCPSAAFEPSRDLLHNRWLVLHAFRGWRARVLAIEAIARMTRRMRMISLLSKAFWCWRTQQALADSARSFRKGCEERRLSEIFVSWRVFCAVTHGPVEHAVVALAQYSSRSVALAELRRRYVYMTTLERSFTEVLNVRLLVRSLLAWRYSLATSKIFRITFTLHSRRVLAAALAEWRLQYRIRQFSALLQRAYPAAVRGGSIVRLPPGAGKPTYEALIYTVFGSLLAEMRPEELAACPTLLALQKACAWSEYSQRGARPLKHLDGGPPLPSISREQDPEVYREENGALRGYLASLPESKKAEVLRHCLERWRRYREASIRARRLATELEAKRAATLLRRAFQIMHKVVRLKGKVWKILCVQRRALCRDALAAWRRALADSVLTRRFLEGVRSARTAAVFRAWGWALLQKQAIRLFLDDPLLASTRDVAAKAFVATAAKLLESNAPVAGLMSFMLDQLVNPVESPVPAVQEGAEDEVERLTLDAQAGEVRGDGLVVLSACPTHSTHSVPVASRDPHAPLVRALALALPPRRASRLQSDYELLCYVADSYLARSQVWRPGVELKPLPALSAGRVLPLALRQKPALLSSNAFLSQTQPVAPPKGPLLISLPEAMGRMARAASVIAASRNAEIFLESTLFGRWVDTARQHQALEGIALEHYARRLCLRVLASLAQARGEREQERSQDLADAFSRVRVFSRVLRAMIEKYDASMNAFAVVSSRYLRRKALLGLRAGLLASRVYNESRISLLSRALLSWRQEFSLSFAEYEKAFRATRLLYLLRKWKAFVTLSRRREQTLQAAAEWRLRHQAWDALIEAWRKIREAEDSRVSKARGVLVIRAWVRSFETRREGIALLEARQRFGVVRGAFYGMKLALQRRLGEHAAEEMTAVRDLAITRLAFENWRDALRKREEDESMRADEARKILLLRGWARRASRSKEGFARLEGAVLARLQREAFVALVSCYERLCEEEDARVEAMRGRLWLRAWRSRARALREGTQRVAAGVHMANMRSAFLSMASFSSRQILLREQADQLYAHFLGRRAVAAWRQAHRLEKKLNRMERTKLIQALRRWERMARDGSIERRAEVRAERFERQKLLSKSFMTWAALAGIETLFDSVSSLT